MKKLLFISLFLVCGCVSTKRHQLEIDEAYVRGKADAELVASRKIDDLQSKVDDYKRVYRIWKEGLKKAEKNALGK